MVGTTNISTSAVKNELGESTYNVGKLCTSSKINMWAKYKPVPLNSVAPSRSGTWYKGDNGLCGLSIPSASGSPDTIYNSAWKHDPPKGGSTSPYRLADFGGYNNSSTWLFTTWMKDKYSPTKNNPTVYIQCVVAKPNITNNLQVTDCTLLSNFRLGVKIQYGTSRTYIITSSQKASEVIDDSGILQCAINFADIYNGSYGNKFTLTTFLTESSYPTVTTFPTVITCYSLPNYQSSLGYTNTSTVTYTSVTAGLQFVKQGMASSINGTYQTEDYYFSNPYNWSNHTYEWWKITVQNPRSDRSVTFKVNEFTWYGRNVNGKYVTNTYNDELKMYNSNKVEAQSFTVSASSTITIYVRTRILGMGATLNSSYITSNTFDNNIYGQWTNASEGLTNYGAGRFELHTYESSSFQRG